MREIVCEELPHFYVLPKATEDRQLSHRSALKMHNYQEKQEAGIISLTMMQQPKIGD